MNNPQQGIEFTAEDFDSWADGYDEDILDESVFPFIGYKALMTAMLSLAGSLVGKTVLDLGCGTGILSGILKEKGGQVWASDFSSEMVMRTKAKFPEIPAAVHDLRQPLPADFPQKYDLITSTYVFHHFPQQEKLTLVERYLKDHLNPGGSLLIGDLVFRDQAAMGLTQMAYPDSWDEEYYWVLEDDLPMFRNAGITVDVLPIRFCAAILAFS